MNQYIQKLLILIFTLTAIPVKSAEDLTFEHLSLEKGISHNLTRVIIQDQKGFMWFGTMFGLIKFDGIKYTTYRNHPSDSLSLSHDDILCILEDHDHNLWIGTRGGGLNRFNRHTESFEYFLNDPDDSLSITGNIVNCLLEDRNKNLWIGTESGLNKLDLTDTTAIKSGRAVFKRYIRNLWNVKSLSDNSVHALFEDPEGNLWVGTKNGLNRFDLYSERFKWFQNFNPKYTRVYNDGIFSAINGIKKNGNSLASILKPQHFEDLKKQFTITQPTYVLIYGLGEGRSEFRGEPVLYLSDLGWLEKLPGREVVWKMGYQNTFYAGGAEKNRVQINTIKLAAGTYQLRYQSDDSHGYGDWNNTPPENLENWGIQIFSISEGQFRKYQQLISNTRPTRLNSISHNSVTSISICEGSNELWIGTAGGGLNRFDINSEQFYYYKHDDADPNSLLNNHINTLFEDDGCVLWVGTSGGLSRLDKDTEKFTNFVHDPLDPSSLSSNFIYTLCKDRSGILWCGTYWGGIDKLDFKKSRFQHIRKNISSSSKLAENNYQALCADTSSGVIWIGTWGDGLIRYKIQDNQFINFLHDRDNKNSLSNNYVKVLLEDRNFLWIGTYGGGLNLFDIKKKQFRHFYYNSRDPESLSGNEINALYLDQDRNLWVGTDGNGIAILDHEQQKFKRMLNDPDSVSILGSNEIYCFHKDSQNRLWIGTSEGLTFYNSETGEFHTLKHNPDDPQSLNNNYIYSIHEAKNGRDSALWIGTAGGLNRFDPESGTFKSYTEDNGLPNRVICGIEEDRNGFLWLSTNKGLSRFDPKMKIFSNFDLSDGLQSNMFNIGSFTALSDGYLAFGGINGMNIFDPSMVITNTFVPPVYITGFRRFNQYMTFNTAINDLNELVLDYDDNFFTIEFAALDYSHPEKNLYAYKLEGMNDRWIHCGNENFANYTNLSPGKYTFRVRGTNSDGVWNMEGAELNIVIRPPFWMTWWFRSLIGFVVLGLLSGAVIMVIRRERQKTIINQRISELRLQALRAQMNPHFIFNTINSIQYFISKKDEDSAYFYLTKFSKLLRRTLENSEKSTIQLAEEIENLKLYLELQLLRYGDKFTYEINVDKGVDLNSVEIPGMILQPYIENSIQHGFVKNIKYGKIIISIKLEKDLLVCTVDDNGIGFKSALKTKSLKNPKHSSSGMKLTHERLDILNRAHKNTIDVSVQDFGEIDPKQNGTRVTIHIPVH